MNIVKNECIIKDIYLAMSCIHHTGIINHELKGRHSDCLVYVISGTTEYIFSNDLHLQLHANNILYLAKGSRYTMNIIEEPYEVIWVDFDFDSQEANASLSFKPNNYNDFKKLFQHLNKEWIVKNNGYRTESFSILYKIYSLLFQSENRMYLPRSQYSSLEKAVKIIANNFSDPNLSICHIADLVGMSEGHFRRIFKSFYSMSPTRYIMYIRIENAKKLLTSQPLSITEIARQSGFTDTYYFCKRFKAETAMTPTQYRKMHSKELSF